MQNQRTALIITAITASLMVGEGRAQEGRVTASLSPANAAYLHGTPIELLLSVTNRSPHPVWMDQSYPRFAGTGHRGVTVSPKERRGAARPDAGPQQEAVGVVLRRRLAAGETGTYKIYLQRFMPGPPVGSHSLAYSIDIPVETEDGRKLAAYADELKVSEFTKSDYWLTRAAEEALAVTESPLVIPYLKTLFEIGSTQNDVSPLGKFRGNSDAENLLLSIIRKDEGYHLPSAISVLEKWSYVLGTEDFASLCAREDTGFKYPLLRYAEKANRA